MRRIFPRLAFFVLACFTLQATAFSQIVAVARNQGAGPATQSVEGLNSPLDLPRAAQFIDPVDGYTAEGLIEVALRENPSLEVARQEIARAEGERGQAGTRPNPTFDFERTRNPVSAPENSYLFGVSYPFEVGGKRSRRIEVAALEVEAARKRLADAERTLRAEVRSAFGEYVSAIQTLQATEEVADLNRQLFRIVEARFQEGDASGLERSLLAVEINRLDADRIGAGEKIAEGAARLRELTKMSDEAPIRVRINLEPANPPSANGLLALALAERPDLQAARLNERKAEAGVRLQKANAIPNVTGSFKYTLDNTFFDDRYGFSSFSGGGPLVNVRDNDRLLTFGVSVELPFFNRNRGNIAAASAEIARARAERERLELTVSREVRVALTRYENASRTLALLVRYVQPGTENNLRIIRGAYEAGQFRLMDVLNEQRKVIEARAGLRAAQLAVYQARVDLERAVGSPLP
jgi:cobalt-zinc-cadmium efflux system outer membrane protein